MTYEPTPEQIAAAARVDEDRRLLCQKVNAKYAAKQAAKKGITTDKDKAREKFRQWANS